MTAYSIVRADDVEDSYAGSDVPGEFHSLKEALGAEQVAVTLIRVPPHCDFEQGTGHFHQELEEIYIITRGTLTMRFEDEVEEVKAGSVVRVAPGTTRSHRNESEEPVELWAVSRKIAEKDATKVEDFWAPSPSAARVLETPAPGSPQLTPEPGPPQPPQPDPTPSRPDPRPPEPHPPIDPSDPEPPAPEITAREAVSP